MQAVIVELMLDLSPGSRAGRRLEQGITQPLTRAVRQASSSAGANPLVTERQPRRTIAHQAGRPGAIGADHVWFHQAFFLGRSEGGKLQAKEDNRATTLAPTMIGTLRRDFESLHPGALPRTPRWVPLISGIERRATHPHNRDHGLRAWPASVELARLVPMELLTDNRRSIQDADLSDAGLLEPVEHSLRGHVSARNSFLPG